MYVRWKILLGLGIIFWLSLCLYDAYYINPTTRAYYADSDEYEWLAHVAQEELVEEDPRTIRDDDIKFPFENYNFGLSMLFWNFMAFIVTIFVCSIGKISVVYFLELRAKYSSRSRQIDQNQENFENIIPVKKSTSSKIPVLTSSRTSVSVRENLTERIEKDKLMDSSPSLLSSSSTSIDVSVRPSKSEMSSRVEQQMEKQCAKLRDEMITLQANSLREHAVLSRKLESVSREKRDLYRQLMTTQKENRAAKDQLEELLAEKALLVKRLECASKEFKVNTKSKKVALASLEESQGTISSLKQDLEKISHEKKMLESKCKILDAEHKNLKERLAKYEPSHDSFSPNKVMDKANSEPKNAFSSVSKDVKKSNQIEISQSQKDVHRVQMRLLNLEKSLDRLKFANWGQKEDKIQSPRSVPNSNVDVQQNNKNLIPTNSDNEFETFMSSITTEAEPPLEEESDKKVKKLLLLERDNLTDEQRRRILEPTESSGDEHSSSFDCFIEFDNEDPFERVGNLLNYVKRPPSPTRDRFAVSGTYGIINNDTSTSLIEEEDTDDWEPPRNRIVSNSPAFQNFLKKMDPLDRTPRKLAGTTQHLF